MKKEDILDQPLSIKKKKAPFRFLFYIASLFLVLRFIFDKMHWPYADWLLIASGSLYVLFSILRLIFHKKKSLFQFYSYLFFILVIPGLIMDYLYIPSSRIVLFIASSIPILFFSHLAINKYRYRNIRKRK